MTALLAMLATGLGTYLSRSIFILALAHRRIPPIVLVAMGYVAPAVFGALIVTLLMRPDGSINADLPQLAGLAGAALAAWFSRNHLLTLATGMGLFWLLRYLL
jgi:branched-subunit amino acid transport protein